MVSDAPCSASPRLCEMNMNLVTAASHHSAAPTPPTLHCKILQRIAKICRQKRYCFLQVYYISGSATAAAESSASQEAEAL